MGRSGAENSPPAPVFTVRMTTCLSEFVRTMVALGTTAPWGSFTVPAILPVVTCAIMAPPRQQIRARLDISRYGTRIWPPQFFTAAGLAFTLRGSGKTGNRNDLLS